MLRRDEIKIDELTAEPLGPGYFQGYEARQQFALGKLNSSIVDTFEPIKQDTIVHCFSCANWSSHELLAWILSQTGPAEVLISVWSISEEAARQLIGMLNVGVITELTAVVDYRAKNRHPSAYQLAQHSFSRLETMPCHAKVTVIQNAEWQIVMNLSSNYTNNPRPEAGFISSEPKTVEFYREIIFKMLSRSKPFE